ncbi:CDP-alcohol phosphatidyltransferase family protein [Nibricoccus aquaticus]|nr:CDP-alcohol phosphatidyltransferase family protein [Nibricoccus aquaticus]
MSTNDSARRPIKARETKWAASAAAALARSGVKPNVISVFSAVFAGGAGVALAMTPRMSTVGAAVLFVVAALGIQLRLLCNLFDGMVAVEGGFKTKSGEIFNELPDRFADAFILVGAGFAAGGYEYGLTLGWVAALLAVGTAYVRALGAAAGAGQCFLGPMAKQHRMAAMTVACVGAVVAGFFGYGACVIFVALAVVVVGTAITVGRRTLWVVRTLEAKP